MWLSNSFIRQARTGNMLALLEQSRASIKVFEQSSILKEVLTAKKKVNCNLLSEICININTPSHFFLAEKIRGGGDHGGIITGKLDIGKLEAGS